MAELDTGAKAPEDQAEEKKEVIELTPTELRAVESGWVPQDEWAGDPDQWRPAKEFLDRGELFKKIDDQNRTVKELKHALEDMKKHHSQVRETEYARALTSLKEQKQQALVDGDAAQVVKLDDQIDLVKDEQRALKQEPTQIQQEEQAPEFVAWVGHNKWYETNEPMRAYADTLGRNLAHSGMSPAKVLAEVERQVKEEFPTKFRNPNRDKPNSVEGSSGKGGKGSDSFTLSDEERRVMQRFVRSGVMTEAKYIEDLKSVRGS